MSELREVQPSARIGERFARFVDRKQTRVMRLALAQLLNQRTQLRVKRNHESNIGLVPVNDYASGLQFDIGGVEFFAVKLAAKAHPCEVLPGWIVAIQAGAF